MHAAAAARFQSDTGRAVSVWSWALRVPGADRSADRYTAISLRSRAGYGQIGRLGRAFRGFAPPGTLWPTTALLQGMHLPYPESNASNNIIGREDATL